jgi:glycosyltransferase involved in cell wall biosynthesis
MGGKPFVFPDPIPSPHASQEKHTESKNNFIVFISSWAEDEPIDEVCTAFINSGLINKGIELIVTGKVKAARLQNSIECYQAQNIKFTGFVSEEAYWGLLKNSLFNIDLTTRDDCMVCGAYESLAVKNTILLSNNAPTMNYFRDAALYTDNTSLDLKERIKFLYENNAQFKRRAESGLVAIRQQEQENLAEIISQIKRA